MAQMPVPEQFPPLHPEKMLPDAGDAVKFNMVPLGTVKVHTA